MRFKFLDWYTQALGATFGILACIYAYLNGYMFVYGNIEGYFDFLGFSGVISSYLLLPLCLLSLFISLIRSYTIKKEILNMSFESINIFISILTVVVGFMGAKIYFTIPAAFILFHILEPYLHNYRNSENQEVRQTQIQNNNIRIVGGGFKNGSFSVSGYQIPIVVCFQCGCDQIFYRRIIFHY